MVGVLERLSRATRRVAGNTTVARRAIGTSTFSALTRLSPTATTRAVRLQPHCFHPNPLPTGTGGITWALRVLVKVVKRHELVVCCVEVDAKPAQIRLHAIPDDILRLQTGTSQPHENLRYAPTVGAHRGSASPLHAAVANDLPPNGILPSVARTRRTHSPHGALGEHTVNGNLLPGPWVKLVENPAFGTVGVR